MSKEVSIDVDEAGVIRFIHDDDLTAAMRAEEVGSISISRASHVEPTADGTGWTADMAPVGGPVLTADDGGPFRTRAEALAAEHAWLLNSNIPACAPCAAKGGI